MISVCVIAKNEADVLGRCLESVKGLDEIVVVDTGSTDNTKEIAKRYTDNVYDFVWCDDFSKARNFAIEQCTSDWILILDADEYLPTIEGIYKLCNDKFEAITMDVLTDGLLERLEMCDEVIDVLVELIERAIPTLTLDDLVDGIVDVVDGDRHHESVTG